jgi:serine/alanine adding enzyme
MKLIKYNHSDHSKTWNDYVNNHDYGNIFHLIEWKNIIGKAYGWKNKYFLIEQDHQIIGIAPFFEMYKPFKKYWISLPYVAYSSILSNRTITIDDFLDRLQTPPKKIVTRKLSNVKLESNVVTMMIKLDLDKDTFWMQLGKSQRKYVRRCEKEGFNFNVENNSVLDDFYKIYKKNLARLGTPQHSKLFFSLILKELDDKVKFFSVRNKENKIVAIQLSFLYKKTMYNYTGFADSEYIAKRVGTLLAWGCIKYAIENNFKNLDYGRSTVGTGPYNYKLQWLAKPQSLEYITQEKNSAKSLQIPQPGIFSKLWSKLPQVITTPVGPSIRKYIP